jgi:PPOX class probable F420-dependent enzyme
VPNGPAVTGVASRIVDETVMRERVVAARVARLGTMTNDGRPHLVPCCFVLAAETIYPAVDSKPKTTLALRRLANIEANPATTLLVDHYDDDWSALWWVRLDGVARVVTDPPERARALTLLAVKYRQYTRAPPPGDVIAIEVTAWRAWP